MRGNDAWEGEHLIDEENIIFRVSFKKQYVLSIHSTQKQAWSLAFERSDFKLKPLFKHLPLQWEAETAKTKQSKSSLSGCLVYEGAGFKSSLRAGLSVPASSRHLFLFARDGHAQKMKPVQGEFLTIASGHCWGPEPGPWVTVYCCGAGHPEHQPSPQMGTGWRAVTLAHQQAPEVSRPCKHKGRGEWKGISWEMIQLLCRAEHSHNRSCNHRGNRVSAWNTISAFFCVNIGTMTSRLALREMYSWACFLPYQSSKKSKTCLSISVLAGG